MVMHSLRITHQEELLCKFIHRHPHPVCCTEYHVVAVQVLGSHTAVVVVAVLDEAVQLLTVFRLKKLPVSFFTFITLSPSTLPSFGYTFNSVRKEEGPLLMTCVDVDDILCGRSCTVL